jgi:hypothetical protein
MLCIHDADHGFETVFAGHQRVAEQHVQQRRRVGGAARLDDDALERRHLAARTPEDQVGEGFVQRSGIRTAQAPGIQQHHVVDGLGEDDLVEADPSQFVHDHRAVGECGCAQGFIEQRGLAAAEEAGEQECRDASLRIQRCSTNSGAGRCAGFGRIAQDRASRLFIVRINEI